jgi:hypothetical protein
MTFEKFTKQQTPDYPAVTIRKNGTLCINSIATQQFNLREIRFATLHLDQKEHLIGIKPMADHSDPSAFRISKEKNRTHVISCQSFLKHCGIHYKEGSKILKVSWDDKGKMILVKLQQNHSKEVKT